MAAVHAQLFALIILRIDDGKSHIKGSTEENHIETLETDKLDSAESAAEACPAQCIYIEK